MKSIRDLFEDWARENHWAIHRNGGEQYVSTATEHAWRGFEAGCIAGRQQVIDRLGSGVGPARRPVTGQEDRILRSSARSAGRLVDRILGAGLPQYITVCPKCHNKRCPKAWGNEYRCTSSNEPGKVGERE